MGDSTEHGQADRLTSHTKQHRNSGAQKHCGAQENVSIVTTYTDVYGPDHKQTKKRKYAQVFNADTFV